MMNMVKAELVYFKVDPSIGEVAMQVYMDPFMLNIGGLDILEVRGVPTEYKAKLKDSFAKKLVESSLREAASKVMMDAVIKKIKLKEGVNCSEILCSSCARAFEGQAITVNCSMSPGFVIADILAGRLLRTSTRPTLNPLLLLRAFV
jgi:hypothetical protein